jgi:hypothetical protein
MTSAHPATEAWAKWWLRLDALNGNIKELFRRGTARVKAKSVREDAREAVQFYFREVRPRLVELVFDPQLIRSLDSEMQELIEFAAKETQTTTYKASIRRLQNLRASLETAIEIAATASMAPDPMSPTPAESVILSTLDQVIPTAALSYQQVLLDLKDGERISYRGTGSELREVLRELLDHLAPDENVVRSGVKLEHGLSRPTMKQKTVFILKARGLNETQRKTASDATEAIEGAVGALTRSVYNRGSLSTHIGATRQEVLTFKGYADAVLAELLEVHKN